MGAEAFDMGAEQSLLGSVLTTPDLAAPALLAVPADAWYRPRHAEIAAVLTDRIRRGKPVDPQIVLVDLLARSGFGAETGPYLHTLMQRAWSPDNAAEYASRIIHCASRRYLYEQCQRTMQRLDQSWVNGWNESVTEFTRDVRSACDKADQADGGIDIGVESPTITDLLSGSDNHDWLVPGLLERGERIILTGGEGLGKSFLVSQFVVCLAAGLHPFTGCPIVGGKSCRVLLVDCENSASQSRRRFRGIVSRVNGVPGWKDNLRIEIRPQGLNLLGRDAAWLEQRVAANAPDMLAIGPLYRLHAANMNDELAARELVAVLDGIRIRHGCALMSEAHAGHEKDITGERRMRPTGSSLFLRWPEFGFGLVRSKNIPGEHPNTVDVVAWRGSREERQWPKQLRHSQGILPWEPVDRDKYMEEVA